MTMNLTNAQAAALEQTLRNSFNMGALSSLGSATRIGRTADGLEFKTTIQEAFDLASLIDQGRSLNIARNSVRRRVAIDMFRCIRITAVSSEDCDALIESGLLKALRDVA